MIILNFNTTVFIMSSFIIEQQIWPILRQILQPYSIGTRGGASSNRFDYLIKIFNG